MIPPVLLSAAMELQAHLDLVTRQSFISIPVWGNIVMNDRRIEKHPLYGKALKFIASSSQSPLSHPPVQPAEEVVAHAMKEPPVAPKPKPRPKCMHKKTLKVVDSSDSDGIKIIDHVIATNPIPPDIRKNSSKQTAAQDQSDETTPVEILKENAIISALQSKEDEKDLSPAATGDVGKGMEDIQLNTEDIVLDDNVRDAASMRHSLPPVTTVSAGGSPGSSAATMHAVMPPRRTHLPSSRTKVMDVDVPADAVVKDLQAMTLQVNNDSASLSKTHEDFYNTIDDLRNQIAELRVRNAAAANSLDALNVRVAAQDVEIKRWRHCTPMSPCFRSKAIHRPPDHRSPLPRRALALQEPWMQLQVQSAAAGASISSGMHAPSGPSGGRVSRTSQSIDTLSASGSGSRHN
ncbi:hypothetical protein EV424DRAFT_1532539 [Suillus variegatus]|nr:hypothetical protein EV424DRAFT_1532539 [Suillus variegatus]